MSSDGCTFLSEEWVRRVVGAIEHAKSTDKDVRSLASEFSLSVAYMIEGLPEKLREQYRSDKIIIYVELDRGKTTSFATGIDIPEGKNPDFIVESSYDVAKKIFLGELNPATAFVRRHVKVKPLMRLYVNPSFTAKSLMTFNILLREMGKVSTVYPE